MKMDLTEKEKEEVTRMNEKLEKEPLEFPEYQGQDVNIYRWYDGKEVWYNIFMENVSVNINEETYNELKDAFEILIEKRQIIMAYIMGIMVTEKGELSYSDFCKRFAVLASLYSELPKFTKKDEEYFKTIENIQLKTIENLLEVMKDGVDLPDMVKMELIKLAEHLHVELSTQKQDSVK